MKKRVLFVIIDALATRVIEPAIEQGRLPFLKLLRDHGEYRSNSIGVFPSITPAATASLITGEYPSEHQIGGAFWYDAETENVTYFGDDLRVIMNRGFGEYTHDFLMELNYTHLAAPTAFELLEEAGCTTTNINLMWFRGPHRHKFNAPLMLALLPGIPFRDELHGPRNLFLGEFVKSNGEHPEREYEAPGGSSRRFGFCDEASIAYLDQLLEEDDFPDFTCFYCPDNDFRSHDEGPANAIEQVEIVDAALGRLIERYGGVKPFLDQFMIAITGDHAQIDLEEKENRRAIRLDLVLGDFTMPQAGQQWLDEEIVACPNMRSATISYRDFSDAALRNRLLDRLLAEPRVDQVFFRLPNAHGDAFEFHVHTADRGAMTFRFATEDDADSVLDEFGNRWCVEGNLDALDATIENGCISSEQYPNALERIAHAFLTGPPQLWATAHPGHEFQVPPSEVHDRGAHGSLHRDDSCSPLIVAGHPEEIEIPGLTRAVDLLPICFATLGVPFPHELGEPRPLESSP